MALIVMTGIPCSGKTKRTQDLIKFFQSNYPERLVSVVSDDSLKLLRNQAYKSSHQEKMTRGSILAETERMLTKQNVLIVDSVNYIRGFRYELYCRARTSNVPTIVLYCETKLEQALEWNKGVDEKFRWDEKLLGEMAARFEVPLDRNKWERLLYTVKPDQPTPTTELTSVIFDQAATIARNNATEINKVEEPNFLYELEKITMSIVKSILEAGRLGEIGVPNSSIKVYLKRQTTIGELKRHQKAFVKLSSQSIGTTQPPISVIGDNFVKFLNNLLDQSQSFQ